MKGLQVVAVTVGFLGFILLTARHVEESPELAGSIHRALDVATAFSAAVYAASAFAYGMGAEDFILARSFALFALFGVARQLSRWQNGERHGLALAALLVGVIFLSVSRTALVAALALFPIAAAVRGGRRGPFTTLAFTLLAASALLAAVFLSDTMYERFFGFDATLDVGGVAVNASGRSDLWGLLLDRSRDHLLFGHGIGSSSVLTDQFYSPSLGHPHNDFLRFHYDLGLVGVALWIAFLVSTGLFLGSHARHRARTRDNLPYFLTPALALIAITASMLTDNSAGYAFVMAPLGILIGCALGLTRSGGVAGWSSGGVNSKLSGSTTPPPNHSATSPT